MGVRSRWSDNVAGYVIAVAATAAAALARFVLFIALDVQAPFFPFLLSVLVAAWYGGLKPGLLATGLGAVFGLCFFVGPFRFPWTDDPGLVTVTALFVVLSVTASSLIGALHTARRRLEEKQRQLEQAEEHVRSVVNHVIDGIITMDMNGTIESFNPAAEMLFGYQAKEVIGQSVKILMPEAFFGESAGYLSAHGRTTQAQPMGKGREVEGRRKDNSTFPMDLAVSQFWLGQRRYFIGIVRDITELKKAEQVLLEADRRKDEFLATLSHELRNPLAPLRIAVELLRRAEEQPEARRQAQSMIERQLGLMVRLIDDLLDISRITRGKLQLRKEWVELAAVVRSALEASRPFIEAQAHELTVTLPTQPVYFNADPIRLAQILVNLLSNAAKYTGKGGHIWLTATVKNEGGRMKDEQKMPTPSDSSFILHPSSFVEVSVRDTGIGIAVEHLPLLFKMFSQVSPALERSQGGLGIGLSLVRGLVELHGGTVEARSRGLGLGSEFVVRLPIGEAPVVTGSEPSGSAEKAGADHPCRILVVDDNQDAADSLATLLQLTGYDTRVAHDGLEGVQAAATFRPRVVLLDIGLPKMNGYEAARTIREQPWGRDIALIALTGWGQEEDKRRSREAGFDYHLTKPADPAVLEELLARIRR